MRPLEEEREGNSECLSWFSEENHFAQVLFRSWLSLFSLLFSSFLFFGILTVFGGEDVSNFVKV